MRRKVHTRRKNNVTLLTLLLTFFLFDNILLSFSTYVTDRMDECLLERRLYVSCGKAYTDIGWEESGNERYDYDDTEQMEEYLALGKKALAAQFEELVGYLEKAEGIVSFVRRTKGRGEAFVSYKNGQEVYFYTNFCDYEAIKDYILTEDCGEPGAYEVILPKYYGPGSGRDMGSYVLSQEELNVVEYDAEELVGRTITGTTYGQQVELKVIGVYDNYALGLDNCICFGEETMAALEENAGVRSEETDGTEEEAESESAEMDIVETETAEPESAETDIVETETVEPESTDADSAGTEATKPENADAGSAEYTEENLWNVVDDTVYYVTCESRADLLALKEYISENLEYLGGNPMGDLDEAIAGLVTSMAMIGNVILAFLLVNLFVNIAYTEEQVAWLRRREYGLMKAVGYRTVDVALFHIKDTAKSTLTGLAVTFAVGASVFAVINYLMEPYLNLTFETFRIRMLPGVTAITSLVGIGATLIGGGIGLRHIARMQAAEALKAEE
ncbi:MAG: ABC transporter permease [Lachnospiraceae bacterium]|nr:ABC transporter permease [Lachnospiraceae bacterium]